MIENGVIKSKVVDGVKYGITFEEVAKTIGCGKLDEGSLCTFVNVKRGSKYKPLGSTKVNDLIKASDGVTDSDGNIVDEFRDYTEGAITKPYGIFLDPEFFPAIRETTLGFPTEESDAAAINAKAVWSYSQPEVDKSNVLGYMDEEPIYGCKHEYVCRIGDFDGYYHLAKDVFFDVSWKHYDDREYDVEDEYGDIIETVYDEAHYEFTVKLNTKSDTDVTFEDLGLTNKYLTLFVVSDTKGNDGNRYVYGNTILSNEDGTMFRVLYPINDENFKDTLTFRLNDAIFDYFTDNVICCVMVTSERIMYEKTTDSFEIQNDFNIAYPKIKELLPDFEWAFVENSAYFIKNNAGVHDTLFSTTILRDEKYSGRTSQGVDRDFTILDTEFDDQFSYITNAGVIVNPNPLTIRLTSDGIEEHRSKRRKIVIKGDPYTSVDGNSGYKTTYLNWPYGSSTGQYEIKINLLNNLPVNGGGSDRVSFYINQTRENNYSNRVYELIAEYRTANGTTYTKTLHNNITPLEDPDDRSNCYYFESIEFANVVDTKNRISGFEVRVNYYKESGDRPRVLEEFNIDFSDYIGGVNKYPFISYDNNIYINGGGNGSLMVAVAVNTLDENTVLNEFNEEINQ